MIIVLIKKLRNILISKLGLDKAIGFTIGARSIQAIGSFASLYLIALFLSKEEQGFYYTFGSVLAIQIFFELGFNGIITQYAAHESAYIKSYDAPASEKEKIAQSRLSSLLHFCIKWFSVLGIGLLVILIIVGFVFFGEYGSGLAVNWKSPWVLLVINTCFSFLLSPLLSFLEGVGFVKDIAKLRLIQQTTNLGILWTVLCSGGKLFAAPVAGLSSLLVIIIILFVGKFRFLLKKIWNLTNLWKINYKTEIFPYQWRISLSWISGYFIFQLFNPVLFATEGAVVAGQMGMTLAVLNGIQNLSMSWISTKVPLFSRLIALKDYAHLDNIFGKTVKQSIFINATGLLAMLSFIYLLRTYHVTIGGMYFGERFLEYPPMLLMMVALFINQFIYSWATYLRCHKQEPFLINSVVGGGLCAISTIIFGKYFGVMGITLGYCLISFILFFWGYWIFKNKKHEWHRA